MPGKYIVAFKDSATQVEIEEHANHISANGGDIIQRFDVIKSFVATIPESYLERLQSSQNDVIKSIEPASE